MARPLESYRYPDRIRSGANRILVGPTLLAALLRFVIVFVILVDVFPL